MNPTSNAASLHSSTNQSQPSLYSAQPNSNPPSTNQSYPSHRPTLPNSDPPSTNQSQPSVFLAQPNSNTLSTNQSQPFLPSGQPNSNPSLLSQQLTSHPNPSSSQTSVTNSVIQPETSNDETRVAIGVVDQVDLTLPTSECKCVIDLHISYKVDVFYSIFHLHRDWKQVTHLPIYDYDVTQFKLCRGVFLTDGVSAFDDMDDSDLNKSYLASNPVNVDSGNTMVTD